MTGSMRCASFSVKPTSWRASGGKFVARRLRRPQQHLHGGVVFGVGHPAHARRQQRRSARRDRADAVRARAGARITASAAVILAGVGVDARVAAQHLARVRAAARAAVAHRTVRTGVASAAVKRVAAVRRDAGAVRALCSGPSGSSRRTRCSRTPDRWRTSWCRCRSAWRRRRRSCRRRRAGRRCTDTGRPGRSDRCRTRCRTCRSSAGPLDRSLQPELHIV